MIKKSLRRPLQLIVTVLIFFTIRFTAIGYPGGAPAGYTGSPGDTHHCVSCHYGSAATVTGWITSNIPVQGYSPGTIYTITATATGSGAKGFEVSPQGPTGTQLGILAAGTNNKLAGGTKYVTQKSAGSSSSAVTYNFTWTAPASGSGSVTFYGAFCIGKSSTKLSTLVVVENTAIPLSATASATPSTVCAGQSLHLNVIPVGGSGTYTYSWSSIPPGFTSSAQDPVVTPASTIQYVAHVTDGTLSVDAPANVTVNQEATVDAGNDTTCTFNTALVPLNGLATDYSSVLWTTPGDGLFSAPGTLSGTYSPGSGDKAGGMVTLTLTASALSPCQTIATDARIIHFDGTSGIGVAGKAITGFTISPNPTRGPFSFRTNGYNSGEVTVTVTDICGKTVMQRVLETSGSGPFPFDLSGSPKGLYLVKVHSGNTSTVQKLVIE
jgi:hypothetical protein